jgi:hypothetical protein
MEPALPLAVPVRVPEQAPLVRRLLALPGEWAPAGILARWAAWVPRALPAVVQPLRQGEPEEPPAARPDARAPRDAGPARTVSSYAAALWEPEGAQAAVPVDEAPGWPLRERGEPVRTSRPMVPRRQLQERRYASPRSPSSMRHIARGRLPPAPWRDLRDTLRCMLGT